MIVPLLATSLSLILTMTVRIIEVTPLLGTDVILSLFPDTKAFSSKVLTIKVGPHEQTTRAVTELKVLSASRKEDVPTGFTRLP